MLLLDTHVWWWALNEPERLSQQAAESIEGAPRGTLRVAAISTWELALLAHKGRIVFDIEPQSWFERALGRASIELAPLTPQVALEAYRLPEPFHDDPADRIIVATARVLQATLVTKDQQIRDYPHVPTSWD
jgi:PIN domain nuclease of toxin-antitoxin system